MASASEDQRKEADHWALDKRVLLAVIVAIIPQTMGAIWWGATIESRIGQAEYVLYEMRNQKLESRVTLLEDQFKNLGAVTSRIEAKLDRLIERESEGNR